MNKTTSHKQPWNKGEKFLIGAILLTVALAALTALWWRQFNSSLNADPVVSVPTPTMPAQNAFDYFNAAASDEVQKHSVDFAIVYGRPSFHPISGSPNQSYSLPQKAALVQANDLTLRTLRQGLAFPYQNPPLRSFSTVPSYFVGFSRLARLLVLDGQVREGRGDWAGAVSSGLDAVQMGAKIPRGGTEIVMQIGTSCEAIGRRPLWHEVDHLRAAQTQAAIHRLQEIIKSEVPFADTLQEEEWFNQASLMEIFRHPTWRTELIPVLSGDFGTANSGSTLPRMAPLGLTSKRLIMNNYTAAMNERIHAARQPYNFPVPATPSNLIVQEIVPDFPQCRFEAVGTEAQNALLLTTLALRAYRLEHGTYPATLTQLTPAYLKQIPSDPFAASGPLRYKRQGSQYVLYSVGPDGKDDGGKPIFDRTQGAPQSGETDPRYSVQQDSRGDIVAGVNIF